MIRIDFSTMRVDIKEVAQLLTKKAHAPLGATRIVGQYQGRYYLIDYVTSRVSRLTLGAYRHLHQSWEAEHLDAEAA